MNGLIDIHSHILHNLDDGVENSDQAFDICRFAVENGISDIIATPHLAHPMFEVKYEVAKERLSDLNKRVSDEGLELNIHLGFECRIHGNLIDQLTEYPEYTLCGKGRFFLLELDSLFVPPPDFDTFVFESRLRGLQPILVHPERYSRALRGVSLLKELVDKGLQIQVTGAALTGLQGENRMQFSEKLLKENIVHYIASDIHSANKEDYELANAYAKVMEMCGKETAHKLFISNPEKIINT